MTFVGVYVLFVQSVCCAISAYTSYENILPAFGGWLNKESALITSIDLILKMSCICCATDMNSSRSDLSFRPFPVRRKLSRHALNSCVQCNGRKRATIQMCKGRSFWDCKLCIWIKCRKHAQILVVGCCKDARLGKLSLLKELEDAALERGIRCNAMHHDVKIAGIFEAWEHDEI
ncbi:hypothetical protein BC831DRAFT_140938 [Entophlyctis helioformis]|nr:hypothetical protein BC831DRAFT_140938 [Entophlyctis helioformis]